MLLSSGVVYHTGGLIQLTRYYLRPPPFPLQRSPRTVALGARRDTAHRAPAPVDTELWISRDLSNCPQTLLLCTVVINSYVTH